jgi:hypothetical protein
MNESFPARDNLRVLVGRKVADGDLPRGALGAVSQTNGSSEVCDACAKHVSPSDVLYRVYGAGLPPLPLSSRVLRHLAGRVRPDPRVPE